jgi:hypothetical protein
LVVATALQQHRIEATPLSSRDMLCSW